MEILSEMYRRFSRGAAVGFLAVVLGGCAPRVTVHRVSPAPVAVPTGSAVQPASQNPADLAQLQAALQVLRRTNRSPGSVNVRSQRQDATARIIDLYGPSLLQSPHQTLTLRDGERGTVQIRLRRGAGDGGVDPALFKRLEPTDHWAVKGVTRPVETTGEGVPLVGTLQPTAPISADPSGPVHKVENLVWSVTAVPEWVPGTRTRQTTLALALYDPHITTRVTEPNGQTYPLAADFTTVPAIAYAYFAPKQIGVSVFLGLRKTFASSGIYATQQPSATQTPLVLVHGLISDPSAFHALQIALAADPEVRRRYQIWFFYYQSSLPVPYAGMLLREDVEKFIHQLDPDDTHPALHRAVLVGHSMGGLLCRLAVTDGGDRYYHHFFRKPLDQLDLTPLQKSLLRRAFYYHASPDVSQVVFIATPQRGSSLASGPLGLLGRLIVRVPLAVRDRVGAILTNNRTALASKAPLRPASSVLSLTPEDPVIVALNEQPMRVGLGIHSILGNRGRPGPRANSSDGVVPYTSSHLPQAESETMVPAGHTGTLLRPETAAEIIRILHQADGDKSSAPRPSSPPATKHENH